MYTRTIVTVCTGLVLGVALIGLSVVVNLGGVIWGNVLGW